jgi:hypothetical protein
MEKMDFEANAAEQRRRLFDGVRTSRCAYGQTADSYVLVVGGTPDWRHAPYTVAAFVAPNNPADDQEPQLYRADRTTYGTGEIESTCYDFVGERHDGAAFCVEIPEDYPASPALLTQADGSKFPLAHLEFEQPNARAEWDHTLPEPVQVEPPATPRKTTVILYSALLNGGPPSTGAAPENLRNSA